MNSNLKWKIDNQDYNETIELYSPSRKILFKGYSDDLVTSVRGEIELKLNYGIPKHIFHHSLRKIGDHVILFPTVESYELQNFFELRNTINNFYLSLDFVNLWRQLRYDPSELMNLRGLNDDDWTLFWFFQILGGPETLSLGIWKDWVIDKIVAEDPEGYPSVLDIIRSPLEFHSELVNISRLVKPVNVYIAHNNSSIFEWKAIDSYERNLLLLNNKWGVRVKPKAFTLN
ncbi:hypothetical protein [Acaryochloris sp. IP29b_bin.137]|uniref:hypothetical protein n=1 Tax=Acaryochloris sp. IP29b_bin.137 TaxID=2969217 RepID=UPI0026080735|nr:hypothetical protein [Acaryochloris sp. IP29b_bin.137]